MKKLYFLFLCLLLNIALFSVSPKSDYIEISMKKETALTKLSEKMLREEFSTSFLETYTSDKLAFGAIYSDFLQSLPLSNFVLSEEKEGEVDCLDLEGRRLISLFFKEDKLVSLSVKNLT